MSWTETRNKLCRIFDDCIVASGKNDRAAINEAIDAFLKQVEKSTGQKVKRPEIRIGDADSTMRQLRAARNIASRGDLIGAATALSSALQTSPAKKKSPPRKDNDAGNVNADQRESVDFDAAAINRMNTPQLHALAEKAGCPVNDEMSVKELRAAIIAHLEAGNGDGDEPDEQ